MNRKHGIGSLIALGAAAAAGAAAVIIAQKMKQNEAALQNDEDAIFLDLDGDGTPDVKLEDRDGDGEIDTVSVDTTGDGDLDTTMADITGDGQVDVLITGNPEVLKALRDSGMEITEAAEATEAESDAAPEQAPAEE